MPPIEATGLELLIRQNNKEDLIADSLPLNPDGTRLNQGSGK
jgi:hypothetical protein